MSMIPYGRHSISQDDVDALVGVLRSDNLTQGPMVPRFEREVADRCGANYAVAVNSATSALHIACLAIGVGPGDVVWTSPITFVASANCARYCGATVDFVDIDPDTYNMSMDRLATKLRGADRAALPKAVIPVHFAGQACDMVRLHALSVEYGFKIIEDASHAIGGRYQGTPIGSCRFSDVTVFSFHPVKIITTGEGGMALTNDSKLANRMTLLRSHGITRDPIEMTQEPDGAWYYQQIELGFNYRMTDLQAGLGLSQLQKLDANVARRHTLAARYDALLAECPVTTPWQDPSGYSGLHLYVIRLKLNEIAKSHREVFDELRTANVGVNLHYIPVYRQPYYQAMGFAITDFVEAERYYADAISIPMFPDLSEAQQDYVVAVINRACGK